MYVCMYACMHVCIYIYDVKLYLVLIITDCLQNVYYSQTNKTYPK